MSIFPSLLHVFRIVHLIPPPVSAPTAPLPSLFSLPLPPLAFPPAFSPSPLSNLSQFSNLSPPPHSSSGNSFIRGAFPGLERESGHASRNPGTVRAG